MLGEKPIFYNQTEKLYLRRFMNVHHCRCHKLGLGSVMIPVWSFEEGPRTWTVLCRLRGEHLHSSGCSRPGIAEGKKLKKLDENNLFEKS